MQSSIAELQPPSDIIVVGCGGVASYLLPCLLKLVRDRSAITLVDGDKLEAHNLDRQLFTSDLIGNNKADSLWRVLNKPARVRVVEEYFTPGYNIPEGALVFGCADNHAARRAILSAVDDHSGQAIIGGNEYTDADAYYYHYRWQDSPHDPRVYFPEIRTDNSGDPTRPGGCQGVAQVASPQLALANFSAANHMLWLFWFYFAEVRNMDTESRPFWPVRHFNSFSRMGTELVKDKQPKE